MSGGCRYFGDMSYLTDLQDQADEVSAHIARVMDMADVTEFKIVDPGMFAAIVRVPGGLRCTLRTGRVVAPSSTFQTALEFLRLTAALEHSLMQRSVARQAQLN